MEYPRALEQAFAAGKSLKEALFPSAPPAPTAVDMPEVSDEHDETATAHGPS